MKSLLVLFILASCVDAASNKQTTPRPEERPINKQEPLPQTGLKQRNEPNALDKKEEDCDEKAKKPVEITPESISLSGTTGCTLDEAHP